MNDSGSPDDFCVCVCVSTGVPGRHELAAEGPPTPANAAATAGGKTSAAGGCSCLMLLRGAATAAVRCCCYWTTSSRSTHTGPSGTYRCCCLHPPAAFAAAAVVVAAGVAALLPRPWLRRLLLLRCGGSSHIATIRGRRAALEGERSSSIKNGKKGWCREEGENERTVLRRGGALLQASGRSCPHRPTLHGPSNHDIHKDPRPRNPELLAPDHSPT